jgi:hypothetical protein
MNNYDQSSTGINVDAAVFYDSMMARINFDDFILEVDGTYWYTPVICTEEEMMYFVEDTIQEGQEAKLYEALIQYVDAEDLESFNTEDYYNEVLEYYTVEELRKDYDVLTNYHTEVDTVEVRGYSQGDYAEVNVYLPLYKKLTGVDFMVTRNSELQFVKNLFFDAPLTARVTINDDEYYLYCDGVYQNYGCIDAYDKEKCIKQLMDEAKGVDISVLCDELLQVLPTVDSIEYI